MSVRVALGASARAISGLVMRQGMTPAIVGLGLGVVASLAIGRVVESMLFGISSRDRMTYATVIVMIVAGALAACLLPARRAASVDAAVTLRGVAPREACSSRLARAGQRYWDSRGGAEHRCVES